MIVWAIFLAGLYLLLRDLIPWLKSQQTGETRTKAYNSKKVLRSEEPERFSALQKNRTDGIVVGLMVIGVGLAFLLFGIFSLVLLLPIGAVMAYTRNRAQKRMKAVANEFN
ncbi:hypothetical protein [Phenylobacterium sp.]|uniref:hypothetical protein n=1 Tax=Phenylobacterium sp. TaxID=1871053 RepID=UPI0025F26C99|nr:hypothetical protein [Phenylobacterium sp.]MBX3485553.1 hypothetical protein [Phenylobacterium sp.]MCW5759362.1 hypothetical protein [Phenylobacterium sp.]